MTKLLISLLAAIGLFFVVILAICAVCGNLNIECKWYQWVANLLFIGFSWIFVWSKMNG